MRQLMLGKARSGARAVAMAAWSAAFTEAAVVRLRDVEEPRRTRIRERWVQAWAAGLLRLFGVAHSVEGVLPEPGSGRACLVVASHRSPLDILLVLHVFGGSVLGRHDLEGWPVLGRAARVGGTIFVDRQDPRSGVKAIREIRRRLQAGRTVTVFPEGTTVAGDLVQTFQPGALSAARGLEVDLIPVGIAYEPGVEFVGETFAQHVLRVLQRRKTRVAIRVGPKVEAARDREESAERLRLAVQGLVLQARADLGRPA
jgi:1-acyl-sn-glycerol-3-phosphate acyltransferase